MFEASVPVLIHFLKAMSAMLTKAETHCAARKIDPQALLQARLFPDMFPLVRQVQLATDFAKGMGARLAGIAVPSYADEEKTFDELKARIAKTVAFLETLQPSQFDNAAARQITLKSAGRDLQFKGADYLANFGLPNFYFHLATAYGLLRHNGVELGKMDFMGRS
jgi:hypothetical protein